MFVFVKGSSYLAIYDVLLNNKGRKPPDFLANTFNLPFLMEEFSIAMQISPRNWVMPRKRIYFTTISLLLMPVKWYATNLHMQTTDMYLIQLFKGVLLLALQCVTHALPCSVMLSSWTRQMHIPITRTVRATLKIHLPYHLISDTEQQEMWTENRVMKWHSPWNVLSVFSNQWIKHLFSQQWHVFL